MRIGILTFHAQVNYGGVLQAYALQSVLTDMGYETVMIDRWMAADGHHLKGPLGEPWPQRLKYCVYALLGTGGYRVIERHLRTIRFINKYLNLTPYPFFEWREIASAKQLGVDCLVVGSDQVWNSVIDPIHFYLLDGAPRLPAIAYAASIGVTALSPDDKAAFEAGLPRFDCISVREKQAVEIIAQFQRNATHVVDPTLLVDRKYWDVFLDGAERKKAGKPRLFCYFIDRDIFEVMPYLERYVSEKHGTVDVFFSRASTIRFPRGLQQVKNWLRFQKLCFIPGVHLHFGAGPREFVQCAARATDAIGDSFHGLMFSIIFGLNVRILRPERDILRERFSRIQGFEDCLTQGRLVADGLEDALNSVLHEENVVFCRQKISDWTTASREWLRSAMESCQAARKEEGESLTPGKHAWRAKE